MVLVGCETYIQQTVWSLSFEAHESNDNTDLVIAAGDTRKLTLGYSNSDPVADSDHKDFTFEIDQCKTIYDTGGIYIDGRNFVVPEDTLDIYVYIDVFYKGDYHSNATIQVINMSITAQNARENYEIYYAENDYLYKVSFYRDCVAEYDETLITLAEEQSENQKLLDKAILDYNQELIDLYTRLNALIEDEIASINNEKSMMQDFIKLNKSKYQPFIEEVGRQFLLFHQPIKGGV